MFFEVFYHYRMELNLRKFDYDISGFSFSWFLNICGLFRSSSIMFHKTRVSVCFVLILQHNWTLRWPPLTRKRGNLPTIQSYLNCIYCRYLGLWGYPVSIRYTWLELDPKKPLHPLFTLNTELEKSPKPTSNNGLVVLPKDPKVRAIHVFIE